MGSIPRNVCLEGDVRQVLRQVPSGSVHACITSPPYWGLRNYGHDGQLGLEDSPEEYVENMVSVFREVRRVLRDDGTLWLNLGDSYNGSGGAGGDYGPGGIREGEPKYPGRNIASLKPKDLVGIPWLVAFALQRDGWYLRSDIIWSKPNPMPESVKDRPTKAHEYVFLLSKSPQYFYDAHAIREPWADDKRMGRDGSSATRERGIEGRTDRGMDPSDNGGRNKRSVWNISTKPFSGAHFAVWPKKLVSLMVQAGTSEHGCCKSCGAPWFRHAMRGADPGHVHPKDRPENKSTQPGNRTVKTGSMGKGRPLVGMKWVRQCRCETNERLPSIVLDPFMGSGTTAEVAQDLNRDWIGCELNPEYIEIQGKRTSQFSIPF